MGSSSATSGLKPRPVLTRDGLELAVAREPAGGIGYVVATESSERLISGVRIGSLQCWPDDRGYFMELLRGQQGVAEGFPSTAGTIQVSAALSYPGTIKAFHYHTRQTDLWAPVAGMLQVALYDLRVASPTFGRVNTIYVGELRTWALRIPPGVAHGYKILGTRPAVLVYATDRLYDPDDEGRISYSDPDIHYDWETQHR